MKNYYVIRFDGKIMVLPSDSLITSLPCEVIGTLSLSVKLFSDELDDLSKLIGSFDNV